MPSKNLTDALKHVYYWRTSPTDSFTDILFALYHKADAENKLALRQGFPFEWIAYQLWNNSENEKEFLEGIDDLIKKLGST